MVRKVILYLGFCLAFLVLFSLYGFWQATHPPKFLTSQTPKDLGWEFNKITLTTSDGIKLAAWFVPASAKATAGKPSSDKVIILLHGYPADKANLLRWAEFLHQDFNLFFLDFRYFGQSQGSLTTIGFHEQQDLQASLDYLESRGFSKTGVMGFSLGGAVGILTASQDERIKALVSDSAFANLELMGQEFYRGLWILKYPLTTLTKIWARIFLEVNPDQIAPEKAATNLKIPILLIHSQTDQTIPWENAQRIKNGLKSNPQAEFFFPEQGSHGFLSADVLTQYRQKVLEFFKKNLQ